MIKFKKSLVTIAVSISFLTLYPILMSCTKNENNVVYETIPEVENINIKANLVVAADGTGDYKTVQEAINAVPNNRTSYFYIYIKKGVYKEVVTIPRNKDYIYLYGEDAATTILTFDNYAKRLRPDGTEYGTGGSSSFFLNGNFIVAENLTFANTAGIDAGQAVAINIGGPRSSFRNCRFLGHQDTWYAGNGTFQYLKDCYIEGSVDFMFGGSTAFFDQCELVSTRGGYLTAASTPENQTHGYVFNKCTVTAYPSVQNNTVYLGRPWRPNARVVFLEAVLGNHIRREGWHNWGNTSNEQTAFYAEYNSTGSGANPAARVSWSHQLTAQQVANYTIEKVIGGQHPQFLEANKTVIIK